MAAIGFRRIFSGKGTGGRSFYAVPTAGDPANPTPWDALTDDGNPVDTGKRNGLFLKKAFRSLQDAAQAGHKVLLIVPLAASALQTREGTTAVVEGIKTLDRDLRKRVAIDLFDLPEEPSLEYMEDIIVPVMAFFERFLARPSNALDDYTVFANLNLIGVSADMEDPNHPDLTQFWAQARKRRLALFAHGVGQPAQAEELKKFEVEGMDGPLLGGLFPDLTEAGLACQRDAFEV